MFKNVKKTVSALALALMVGVFGASVSTPSQSATPVMTAPVIVAHATGGGNTDFLDGISMGESGDLSASVGDGSTDFNNIMSRYKTIIMAFTGILTITCFGAMVFQITQLAAAGSNESARRKAIGGILTTGIGTALLGSATVVIAFFYNAIGNTSGDS